MNGNEISKMPAKMGAKELDARQGSFGFQVDCQAEIDRVGMDMYYRQYNGFRDRPVRPLLHLSAKRGS